MDIKKLPSYDIEQVSNSLADIPMAQISPSEAARLIAKHVARFADYFAIKHTLKVDTKGLYGMGSDNSLKDYSTTGGQALEGIYVRFDINGATTKAGYAFDQKSLTPERAKNKIFVDMQRELDDILHSYQKQIRQDMENTGFDHAATNNILDMQGWEILQRVDDKGNYSLYVDISPLIGTQKQMGKTAGSGEEMDKRTFLRKLKKGAYRVAGGALMLDGFRRAEQPALQARPFEEELLYLGEVLAGGIMLSGRIINDLIIPVEARYGKHKTQSAWLSSAPWQEFIFNTASNLELMKIQSLESVNGQKPAFGR